jgi:hypothetical protein
MRVEELARFMEASDPEAAERWRDANSDAGRYLLQRAKWNGQVSDLVRRAAEVEADIARQGFWEYGYEWRISTEGSERIERSDHGYRVATTCNGDFTAAVAAMAVALEASHVLAHLQKDLFYALSWPSNDRRTSIKDGEPYLMRISAKSIQRFRPRLEEIARELDEHGEWVEDGARIVPGTWRDWEGTEASTFEVSVGSDRLSMSCTAWTLDRATEFAGIYQSLQADIRRLLDWWN